MTSFLKSGRSQPAALWLFAVAVLVFAMVILGGTTRLTNSGLSITDWKPIRGVIPPLSAADWAFEFRNYQRIPQYQFINKGMSLDAFKGIYWWEWAHRLLGRLVGVAFAVPFLVSLRADLALLAAAGVGRTSGLRGLVDGVQRPGGAG